MPSIILADGPTGNLDSVTTEEIMNVFTKLNDDGNTIVMITHEENIAKRTKKTLKLQDGIITSGK